jgi:hypothetical protein
MCRAVLFPTNEEALFPTDEDALFPTDEDAVFPPEGYFTDNVGKEERREAFDTGVTDWYGNEIMTFRDLENAHFALPVDQTRRHPSADGEKAEPTPDHEIVQAGVRLGRQSLRHSRFYYEQEQEENPVEYVRGDRQELLREEDWDLIDSDWEDGWGFCHSG